MLLFTSRLKLDDTTVLTLIEQDAAARRWIVPARVYQAAETISDPALKARVDRVLSLRQAATSGPAQPAPASIAVIPDRLMSTRVALETLEGGGN